jgi:hypothetical protein
LDREYIIPSVFDERVVTAVAVLYNVQPGKMAWLVDKRFILFPPFLRVGCVCKLLVIAFNSGSSPKLPLKRKL